MRVLLQRSALLALLILLSFPNILFAEALPSILVCSSNMKSNSGFDPTINSWGNESGEVTTGEIVLRDKVFAKLDTDRPSVRSMTQDPTSEKKFANDLYEMIYAGASDEFDALIVSRTEDSAFLTWNNAPWGNKLWTALVDRKNKRAVVSQVYENISGGIGAEYETLDCR